MDPFHLLSGGEPPPPPPPPQLSPPTRKELQIQGPRPTALQIHQQSHKIKKPPRPPARQQPVIIYAVSPKIIHTEESDFMAVVQRLTGLSSGNFSNDGNVSPAARLAATEKASPKDSKANAAADVGRDEILEIVEGLDFGQAPGILSPAPGMLPPVPPGFFSPVTDPLAFFNEMSPYFNGNGGFMASPSAFLSAPIVSPLTSPDIFNLLMDL